MTGFVNPPSLFRQYLLPLLVLAIAFFTVYAVVALRPKPAPAPPPAEFVPDVLVQRVSLKTDRPLVTTTGRITSRYEIQLVARVGGQVKSATEAFRAGAPVEAGALLLELDNADYLAQLDQAEASLAQAQQQLASEQGLADQARREWRDLGNAQSNSLFLREPQLKAAKAQLQAAQSSLERAQLDLQRTRISAPFAGVVVTVNADVGQYVNPGATLATIHSTANVQAELSLTPDELGNLNWDSASAGFGDDVQASIILRRGSAVTEYPATISHISPQVEAMTQLTSVVLDLTDADTSLVAPGQFVGIKLSGQPIEDTVRLPEASIYERNQVLRVVEGRLQVAPVRVLARDGSNILVSGLLENDLIILDRPLWVFPGQLVNPVELTP